MHQPKTTVREWMAPDPVTISADTSLLSAFELMQTRVIRRLPVVDPMGRLCGIITRSDVYQAVPIVRGDINRTEAAFALAGRTVEDIMTADPVSVTPDEPIQNAARQMIARKISGVPVVEDGKVVGVITESDIFRLVVESWLDETDASA